MDVPSVLISQFDQERGLPLGLLTNVGDASLGKDGQSRPCRLQGWDVGRAVHEAVRRVGIAVGTDFEVERVLVSKPSRDPRLQVPAQIGAHVEVADTRSSAEPFQDAAAGKIDIQLLHVDRHGAGRVKRVEHYVRAYAMRLL